MCQWRAQFAHNMHCRRIVLSRVTLSGPVQESRTKHHAATKPRILLWQWRAVLLLLHLRHCGMAKEGWKRRWRGRQGRERGRESNAAGCAGVSLRAIAWSPALKRTPGGRKTGQRSEYLAKQEMCPSLPRTALSCRDAAPPTQRRGIRRPDDSAVPKSQEVSASASAARLVRVSSAARATPPALFVGPIGPSGRLRGSAVATPSAAHGREGRRPHRR